MHPDDEPNGEAEMLSKNELLQTLLDEMEKEATEAIIDTDDENKRDQNVWEVRSIRNLRRKLTTLAGGKTTPAQPRAVA